MSFFNIRSLMKCNQFLVESLNSNVRTSRSIATWKTLRNQSTAATEKETTENKSSPESNETAATSEEFEKLTKELSEYKIRTSELLDKYKRSLADGENLRMRLTKQIEDAKIYGIQSFCKDLLDVADVLSKATESVPKEEVSEKNPHLKSLYEGLLMTEAQLQAVFKRHGLEPVNPINEKFDPNQHEALFQQEVQGKEPGVVVVVSKIGYKLHDRVIRPASVGVSK